jgi:DNA-binding MarR family transcriptional regulator
VAFRLDEDLGFLVARTHRTMRRWIMARLAPLGITYEQFKVLNALCQEENVTQAEMADRVQIDKSSLARMLTRMEAAGLISRHGDPADSRLKRICLTDRGRRLALRVAPYRDLGLRRAAQGMSEEEVKELKRLLVVVFRNMDS